MGLLEPLRDRLSIAPDGLGDFFSSQPGFVVENEDLVDLVAELFLDRLEDRRGVEPLIDGRLERLFGSELLGELLERSVALTFNRSGSRYRCSTETDRAGPRRSSFPGI